MQIQIFINKKISVPNINVCPVILRRLQPKSINRRSKIDTQRQKDSKRDAFTYATLRFNFRLFLHVSSSDCDLNFLSKRYSKSAHCFKICTRRKMSSLFGTKIQTYSIASGVRWVYLQVFSYSLMV